MLHAEELGLLENGIIGKVAIGRSGNGIQVLPVPQLKRWELREPGMTRLVPKGHIADTINIHV